MINIEQNLKDICRQKGLTLTDVANRIGTSPSNLLSSIKGNPTIARLQSIAEALQINVSQLISDLPEPALGVVIIEGKTYNLSMPASSTVKLPYYNNYKKLQTDLRKFIKKSLKDNSDASAMGMVETTEVFALIYNPKDEKFHLSSCCPDGKTITKVYDKYYYAIKRIGASNDKLEWLIDDLIEDIISDLEGADLSIFETDHLLNPVT